MDYVRRHDSVTYVYHSHELDRTLCAVYAVLFAKHPLYLLLMAYYLLLMANQCMQSSIIIIHEGHVLPERGVRKASMPLATCVPQYKYISGYATGI